MGPKNRIASALRLLVAAMEAPGAFDVITPAPTRKKTTVRGVTKLRLVEGDPEVVFKEPISQAIRNAKHVLDEPAPRPAPIPMLLHCPVCGERHIDEDGWEHRPHRDHACQQCGHVWRPAHVDTVGVRFLPGYKNGDGVRNAPRSKRPHAVDKLIGESATVAAEERHAQIEKALKDAATDSNAVVLKARGHALPDDGYVDRRRTLIANLSNWGMRDLERADLAVARLGWKDEARMAVVSMLIDGKSVEHEMEILPHRSSR